MALGVDDFRDRELARHHAREAWDEAVETRAQELQSEDPDLGDEEAQDFAEEQLLQEIRRVEDERAAELMEGRG